MASMTAASPVCVRASALNARTSRASRVSGRVVAPKALRRSAVTGGRRVAGLEVRRERRTRANLATAHPHRLPANPPSEACGAANAPNDPRAEARVVTEAARFYPNAPGVDRSILTPPTPSLRLSPPSPA